jgi:hypothetical protein
MHVWTSVDPYWIEAGSLRLAILPRPRGYDWLADDIAAAQRAGVNVIVSALTEAESQELGLSEEARCCSESTIEFLSFPVEDRSLPESEGGLNTFIDSLDERVKQGKSVAIHCRAGIGRSSILCACLSGKVFRPSLPFRKFKQLADALCRTRRSSASGLSPSP